MRCFTFSMNRLLVFFVVLFLFIHVKAQHLNTTNSYPSNSPNPSITVICGIISVLVSVTILILAYVKFCYRSIPDLSSLHHNNLLELVESGPRFSGIDKAVIESLPFFRFSSLKGSKEGLECAVCLSKFENSEVLRLLPNCKHAFHMNCIDTWLESHSSCPLCRYKFDERELASFTYTNSLRYIENPPNLELFVQREQDHQRSSRFNLGSSFLNFGKFRKDDVLTQEVEIQKLFHKVKHKIIVSDIVYKSRWSDLNSSDLMFLNSEMLNSISSKRFSPSNSEGTKFQYPGFSMNEHVVKIKEDLGRKRLYDSKVGKISRSNSFSCSSFPCASNNEGNQSSISRLLSPGDKRSMSEITNLSRFRELGTRNRSTESLYCGNTGRDERMRRLWLPIARRTVQWFAGRERSSEELERKIGASNV